MKLHSLWLAFAMVAAGIGSAVAGTCPNVPTVNIATDGNGNTCAVRSDLRGSVSINSAVLNQIGSVMTDGGRGAAGWQITGLAASGATLTPVFSEDGGATWTATKVIFGGAPVATLTADGSVEQLASHQTAIGFQVTVVGTGTITAVYTVSVSSIDPMLRNSVGSQADPPWSGTGNGSVVAVLKSVQAKLGSVKAVTYAGSPSASVGTTSGTLVTAGAYTTILEVCTLPGSIANVWLRPDGGTAAPNQGIPVFANGGCTSFGTPALPIPTANINAMTDGGVAQTVTLAGE
jgi:hypothetical protein